ncbi:MAG: DMT family transporter [Cohaesibacter sp.]|nr:DMT family transporter [Cohaesibacter sp.]
MLKQQAQQDPNWIFFAALLGASFLMAAAFVVGKMLLVTAEPFPLAGWRFVLAALVMLPFLAWENRDYANPWRMALTIPKGERGGVILIGILQTGLVMGLLFLSLDSLTPPATAILIFTNPLWVGLIAPLLLGERLKMPILIGLVMGVAGITLAIGIEAVDGDLIGCLYALSGGMVWALSTLLQKRLALTIKPLALAFWHMLIGGTLLIVAGWIQGDASILALSGWDWGLFLWLAIPSSSGAFGLWAIALAKGGASHASSFLFLTPLFAVLLSFLMLGTAMSLLQLVGGALIFIAIWLINRA